MKLFFSRIFCLFLALQVLLSSAGFAMNEHYCKIRGEKVWSFKKVRSCCTSKPKSQEPLEADLKNVFEECSCCTSKPKSQEPSKTASIKKDKCCADKVFHAKVSTESGQFSPSLDSVDFASLVWQCQLPPMWVFRNEILPFETSAVLYYHSPAPPLSGRDILVNIQSFLI